MKYILAGFFIPFILPSVLFILFMLRISDLELGLYVLWICTSFLTPIVLIGYYFEYRRRKATVNQTAIGIKYSLIVYFLILTLALFHQDKWLI
jgi:hypothetical protein